MRSTSFIFPVWCDHVRGYLALKSKLVTCQKHKNNLTPLCFKSGSCLLCSLLLIVKGGFTPIGPVLTTATAVKMWSRGHGTSEAPVKRSSSKLVPTTVKINPHLLFCIKLQSVTRPDPNLIAIKSTEEHNCHDICLHAQLSYLSS